MRAALDPNSTVEYLKQFPPAVACCCCDAAKEKNAKRTQPLAVYSPDNHIRIFDRTPEELERAIQYWRTKNGQAGYKRRT